MCAAALVMGMSTGFNAEAKVKKGRKAHKVEKVAAVKANKDVKEKCDKKAECKDAKACDMKKAECKDGKTCDKAAVKGAKKAEFQKFEKNDTKLLKKDGCKDMKGKADCASCDKKEGHKCARKNPCCEGGECKKNGACGKEKCKPGSKECCD